MHVKAGIVTLQLAEGPMTCLMWLLALMDLVPSLLIELVDIKGPLHCLIAKEDITQAVR